MEILYLECNMGAAGDMLAAALLELYGDQERFLQQLNGAGIPGVRVLAERSVKCGITGTHLSVSVNGVEERSEDVLHHHGGHGHDYESDHHHDNPHSHSGMWEIEHLIQGLAVSERVKADALAVYRLIAEAESRAHGKPVEQIHFHEVGTMDAVADIVGVCLLVELLAPGRIVASPVHVGSGRVRCAHGVLPVPAPATAHILEGVPVWQGAIQGELCTPTGAALLKHFVSEFSPMPAMRLRKTGYGMGKKDFEQANCVRAFLGENDVCSEQVAEISCNLDDMTPEAVAFAQQILLEEGAMDAYTIPIGMKKGRAGVLLTCMCRVAETEKFVALMFRHTTTLGLRETVSRRYTLDREQRTVETAFGPVRFKHASGYGVKRQKAEYEDLARIARQNGISLAEAAEGLEENR